MDTIEILELKNTFGCAWRESGGELQYGFRDLPPKARLWMGVAGGNAVSQLIEAGLGTVVATEPGSYGGTVRTVSVSVEDLEETCRRYWERANEREASVDRSRCHYCGQKATGTGFFGEPVCSECGG